MTKDNIATEMIDSTGIDCSNPPDTWVVDIDVQTLLPQQKPFILVGSITHFDMDCVVTETTISEECIFVENGVMLLPGLIENIAQTCAARIGYVNKYILKKGIQIGFIGAIKNLVSHGMPKVGDVVTTEVRIIEEIFGMVLAKAEVRRKDTLLVSSEIKIALREEVKGNGAESE